MIYKLLSYLSLISVTAYGDKVKQKFAISTQSFERPDIPISYKFTNIHSDKRNAKPEQENNVHQTEMDLKTYPVIQYAPLNYDTKTGKNQEEDKVKPKETKSVASVSTGRHVYTGNEKHKYDHLEPKPLKQDNNVHQQNYRSFISGHNVEKCPETTGHYLEQSVDTFINHKDYMTKPQKVRPPKFVYYQKTKDDPVINSSKYNNIVEEAPANNFKYLEFHPDGFDSGRNAHKKTLPLAHYSLHNLLLQEKQQQTYAHPRIHLNIARSYHIANQPAEAHIPPALALKPLTVTNLILNPSHILNTLMYPSKRKL